MRPRSCLPLAYGSVRTRGSLVGIRSGMHARGSAIRPGNRVRAHRSRVVIGSLRTRHLRFLIAFGRNAHGTRGISGTLQALRLRARRLPIALRARRLLGTHSFPMSRLAMSMPADDLLAPT